MVKGSIQGIGKGFSLLGRGVLDWKGNLKG